MKKINIILTFLLLLVISGCSNADLKNNELEQNLNSEVEKKNLDYNLRIGWQSTWATQGQLAMILQKTDILKSEGINAKFIGFSYGGPLNQGALAGDVDVVFTADQPALTLLSKSNDWVIIGRLMYNSGALMVHPNSDINSVSDLKNKKVAVPFVAAVHRVLIGLEKDANLVPEKDVKNVNLGINEIINTAQSGKDNGWGDIDAMMVWDPTPFILEEKNLTKTIARGDIIAVILMRKDKLEDPELPKRFLNAFRKAYYYYSQNVEQSNDWFAKSARIKYNPDILNKAANFEPNVKAKSFSEIRVKLSKDDLKTLEEVNQFMVSQNLIKSPIDLNKVINLNYLENSENELTTFSINEVKIIN